MAHSTKYSFILLSIMISFFVLSFSCTHDPFLPDEMEPDPVDTMKIDTMEVGIPCDPNIAYFENDILPILKGSCAISGCHDAETATDGVILDNYEDIINTADVVAFDLNESELYEVINEDDPDKVMPPTGKLDNESIYIIAQWILQGAENNYCDKACDTMDVTFNDDIMTILNVSCNACHSTEAAFGGVILDQYDKVKIEVDNGRLDGAISWKDGYKPMPQGQDQLDSCSIAKIQFWINDGAQDN